MWPLHPSIVEHADEVARRFCAELPLPDFAVLEQLLADEVVEAVLAELDHTPFATYCVWSPTDSSDDLRRGFRTPDPAFAHVTVHERPLAAVPILERIAEALAAPPALAWFSEVCGRSLASLDPRHVLTRWGPGSFIAAHCDAGPADEPVALVLSLSLTRDWQRAWGGETCFAWAGLDRRVTTWPKANQAVLFRPHAGSTHWVEPVDAAAPPLRHTWTLHFRCE